ncbi:MAG: GDSL-type esterase/lipase family protein, partial [Actinomycetes bacterium]
MSRATRARRVAVAAAYGGGGLGLLTAGAFGVIRAEAFLARRAIGEPTGEPPVADGLYGRHYDGEPISVALIGDSSACGLGVEHVHQTPGAMLAAGLAECADRPVQLTCAAKVGAQSSHLEEQIERVAGARPEVVVVMVGTNDVTHGVRAST